MDLAYNFVDVNGHNNGNVASITNNIDTARSQSFTYYPLNRIATAQTSATAATNLAQCWGERYGYDPWGNLTSIVGIQPQYTGCTQESGFSITATLKNQIPGDTYDAAGNVISIPAIANYAYDAENRLISTAGVTYTYDGDGKRVMKSSGTIYWYGAGSGVLMETDLANNEKAFYTYFAGKRFAVTWPSNEIDFYQTDHLGSSRAFYNQAGANVSDFYPFGGERVISTSSPSSNYKFTSKERDSESGLDNFIARYDSSSLGRLMSPDEPLIDQDESSPQSWNLYSYVRNNPINNTDPSGNACVSNGKGGFVDDNSGGQSCKDAQEPQKVEVKAKAPPSADDQRILDFANDLNRYNIQNNVLKLAGAGALIGATGGAACYYLCPAATVTTLGTIGTAGAAAGPVPYKTGDIIDEVVQTSAPVRIYGEVVVEGTQVTVKNVLVYAADSAQKLNVGTREMLKAIRP